MTLTEQWKKGELKAGWYYITTSFADEALREYFDGDEFRTVFTCNVKEVLAPVPSYEEWQAKDSQIDYLQQKVSVLESENQQLKELLLQIHNRQSLIREYLSDCKLGNAWDLLYQTENEIDNAIGEKNE